MLGVTRTEAAVNDPSIERLTRTMRPVGTSIERLLARLESAQGRLARLVEGVPDWPKRSYTKAGSKSRTIDEFLGAVEAHVRNHQGQLSREVSRSRLEVSDQVGPGGPGRRPAPALAGAE